MCIRFTMFIHTIHWRGWSNDGRVRVTWVCRQCQSDESQSGGVILSLRMPRWCWPPLIYRAKHSRNVFLCHTYTMELCNIQWRWSYCYSVSLAWLIMIDRNWVSSTLGCTMHNGIWVSSSLDCSWLTDSGCPPRSIAHDWQNLHVLRVWVHMHNGIRVSPSLERTSHHYQNVMKNAFHCYRHYRNAYHCYKRCRNVLLCYKYNQWHAWVH